MKRKQSWFLLLWSFIFTAITFGGTTQSPEWIVQQYPGYTLLCTAIDTGNAGEYVRSIDEGIAVVQKFFDDKYKKEFKILIHPNRISLDTQWRADWKMPDFKSECWMVAAGVAAKLDMISPKRWDTEACEHHFGDNPQTQQLITHELVHVYHGQLNESPDFSHVTDMDWFVEGVATYASGQCDAKRIAEIQKALSGKTVPTALKDFWSGRGKYGLSGSIVMYIDWTYGRRKLQQLLKFNKQADILGALDITEADLLAGWEKFIVRL